VATTWLISFKQIRDRDSLAANYLLFMTCIDSKDIPQSLLLAGTSRKTEMKAIRTLEAYSFIVKRPADLALDLHRLVHLDSWTAEEIGLVGAAYYVSQLTQAEMLRTEEANMIERAEKARAERRALEWLLGLM